jgi:hypothetical protein
MSESVQPHRSEAQVPSLRAVLRHPVAALVAEFNWKTASISAILRATMFFCTNLRAGHQRALRATLVEAVFAILAMGLFGTITQRIRNARPAWLTGLAVWLVLPSLMLTVQFFVHRAFGTPRLVVSMIASFCFAALGTGFTWFAMRRGALLAGSRAAGNQAEATACRSFTTDLRTIPALVWEFITAAPRALFRSPSI